MTAPPRRHRVEEVERFTAFDGDPVTVARRLLGQRLVRVLDGRRLSGLIVEVEAYLGVEDRAAHSYGGRRTARNASMYLVGGHAYVYFTYGMHFCFNVVCGRADHPVAVLIRGLQPEEGVEEMSELRARAGGRPRRATDLCSGPARLTQALAIDRTLDGIDLRSDPRLLIERTRRRAVPIHAVDRTPRIGVAYAGSWAAVPLRFALRGNPHVSGALRAGRSTRRRSG